MKSIFLTLLLIGTAFHAVANPEKELRDIQKLFDGLTMNEREAHITFIKKAEKSIREKNLFKALEYIDEAEKIFSKNEATYVLRGACLTEFDMLDRALEEFEKALSINPSSVVNNHNKYEILFAKKDWQAAHDGFLDLIELLKENQGDISLIEFKVMLCKLKLGKIEAAKVLSEKYNYMDDTPFYYYSQAALAYEVNQKSTAEEYLKTAMRVFPNEALIHAWNDTLVIAGHLRDLKKGRGEFNVN